MNTHDPIPARLAALKTMKTPELRKRQEVSAGGYLTAGSPQTLENSYKQQECGRCTQ